MHRTPPDHRGIQDDLEHLDSAITQVSARLGSATPEQLRRLGGELADLLDRRQHLETQQHEGTTVIAQNLNRAVSALVGITTGTDLVGEACRSAAELSGARLVMFSTVADGTVVPHAAFEDDKSTDQLPPEFTPAPQSPEFDAVTSASIATADSSIDRPWLDTDSFTVVPVTVGGTVRALLHLDVGPTKSVSDALGAYTEVVGVVAERVGLQSRGTQERSVVQDSGRRLTEGVRQLAGDRPERLIDERTDSSARGGLLDTLTDRERDVARLLLTGASNSSIADALVITVDTVKSHVKAILRKSVTTNRAELIAQYRSGGQ